MACEGANDLVALRRGCAYKHLNRDARDAMFLVMALYTELQEVAKIIMVRRLHCFEIIDESELIGSGPSLGR